MNILTNVCLVPAVASEGRYTHSDDQIDLQRAWIRCDENNGVSP